MPRPVRGAASPGTARAMTRRSTRDARPASWRRWRGSTPCRGPTSRPPDRRHEQAVVPAGRSGCSCSAAGGRALSRPTATPSASGSSPAGTRSTGRAPAAARDLVARPGRRPGAARARRSAGCRRRGLHGDLKLANVALARRRPDRAHRLADDDARPVAVELGWFLVSNSGALPIGPEAVLDALSRAARARGEASRSARRRRSIRRRLPVVAAPDVRPATLVGDWDGPGRPRLDRRPAPARLAQGPRCRGGRDLPSGVAAADDLALVVRPGRRGRRASTLSAGASARRGEVPAREDDQRERRRRPP